MSSKSHLTQRMTASERLALRQLSGRDQDAALATLLRARQAEPDNQRILCDLGILEDQMKLHLDSAATLEHPVALKPSDPGGYDALGRADLDLGKLELAEKEIATYLEARPHDASAHCGLGKIYAEAQQPDKASGSASSPSRRKKTVKPSTISP